MNLIGKKVNHITVISFVEKRGSKNYWLCKCDCGNELIKYENLINESQYCFKTGCPYIRKDLTGNRVGSLTVLKIDIKVKDTYLWICQCECGNLVKISSKELTKTKNKRQFCSRRCPLGMKAATVKKITHGKSKSKAVRILAGIKRRCYNEKCKAYPNYGGRGIIVCDEWRNSYEKFILWYEEKEQLLIEKSIPRDIIEIDRIDVNGNYYPENCRLVTIKEQARNKRNSLIYEINGEKICLKEISERYEIQYGTLRVRLKKLTIEEAINVPRYYKCYKT